MNDKKHARNSLPWSSLEQQVVRVQKQISQACQRGDKEAVHTLQQRLMESEAARLLAVRRVAEESQGKDTAGVDGVKSLTAEGRLAMASAIHPRHWSHQPSLPVRRVWITKPGTGERRPLAILPMIDRCKQALVKLALEPEWEVQFEAHSYGFRPNRGTHDAIATILVAIERRPAFVFGADIEGAFDHVNQTVILDKLQTYPALRTAIQTWLKAGVMDGGSYYPSETGIPQGGVLSPLLLNVALHGMEAVVAESSANGHAREQPLLVRYADDFVILHPELKELQQAVRRVRHWLATMGLQLHADKTRLAHTLTPYQGQIGFDFLGFNIQQENNPIGKGTQGHALEGNSVIASLLRQQALWEHAADVKTIISPSQEASRRHLAAIEHKLQQLQTAPQARVIEELNPLIVGWAAYYNGVVPAATMGRYDDLLEQRLIHWASKHHPGKARDWLLARYWQRIGEHRRAFAVASGAHLRTYRQTSILKNVVGE
ncbi:MAG: reverse transcriptase domain-containing protein [Ktedonobacteraceae bacterium]